MAGISDQLLFSLSNFVLSILVARSVSAREFGAFSLVVAIYIVVSAVSRGLTSETLIVRFSASEREPWRRAATNAAGASLTIGIVAGAGLLVCGALTTGTLAAAALALGVMSPGLVTQDYLRFAALSCRRPQVALVSDGLQFVVQCGLSAYLLAADQDKPWMFIAVWGLGAYLGGLYALVALRLPLRPWRTRAWFAEHGSLAVRYALDDLGQQGSQQAATYAVAGLGGLTDAGSLRGAQTVFNPPSILNLGVQAAVIPELVRVRKRSLRRLRNYTAGIAATLGPVNGLWGVAMLVCPTSIGEAMLGPTWDNAHHLFIYFLFAQLCNGIWVAPMAGLRSLEAANRTLYARSVVIVLRLGAQMTGAFVDGATGVAVAAAIVAPIQAVVWWLSFRIALRDAMRESAKRRVEERWQELVDSAPPADERSSSEFVIDPSTSTML